MKEKEKHYHQKAHDLEDTVKKSHEIIEKLKSENDRLKAENEKLRRNTDEDYEELQSSFE